MEDRVKQLEDENKRLKQKLAELESRSQQSRAVESVTDSDSGFALPPLQPRTHFSKEDVTRYGRQLILPEIASDGIFLVKSLQHFVKFSC